TTSAVVADALDAAVSISNHVYWPHSIRREGEIRVTPMSDTQTRYYLRVRAEDRPGVLALIAGVLGDAKISIASIIQKEVDGEAMPEIVIMTHTAREADLQAALKHIDAIDGVGRVEQVLRVLS